MSETKIPEAAIEAAVKALTAEGAAVGNSLHSWRCEYPDRYGPCTCVPDTAREVLEAAAPYIAAEALKEAAVQFYHREVEMPDMFGEGDYIEGRVKDWLNNRADQIGASS